MLEKLASTPYGTPEYNAIQLRLNQLAQLLQGLSGTASVSSASMMGSGRMAIHDARASGNSVIPAASALLLWGGGGMSIGTLSVAVYGASTDSPHDFAEKFEREMTRVLSQYNSRRR